mmetsp:Transcript_16413/g.45757  ORF Transcript_16413/g.45757 Transcript_16413/m.45757 type:complete len:807 (+) Transcript_16413:117-2537(+)|eukprot:CAMPEP_0119565394 /NCGR_PEP_ID=MMETSP1352-20130426/29894_1 /TAXON_ID=265584 /ORGANISM="Stauroneis constricta, Strain CCMP1120" /LENGTH=806 /DNA_ID=CAMNT_0007614297 /DNA_START=18 /DNA_END=2438 /DNA_ORIENTATION=+
MWSSLAENAKKGLSGATKNLTDATKNLTDVMEKAGDSITQAASKASLNAAAKKADGAPSASDRNQQQQQQQQKSAGTDASSSLPNDADKANETTMKPPAAAAAASNIKLPNVDKDKLLSNLKMGWSSVVETTKRSIEATEDVIRVQQHRLELTLPFGQGKRPGQFYKRDPKAPLDVEALRDAEVVYITDRIITMGHPAMKSNVNPNITAERKLAAVSHLLQRRHDGRYLVWNLSEVNYDLSILDDQVLTFSFPGSPAPPLGLLLKLLVSMENWMKADDRNVAVVHCLTGKGRTSTVLAAFLCWMGEAGFSDINQALTYIAQCKKISPSELAIPSQRRYAGYFKNMLDGVRPSQPPILLKRIIMSEAPKYAKGPPRENPEGQNGQLTGADADDAQLMGCAPYLQIFKGGQLLFTTAATLHINQKEEELPFVQGVDGPVPFHVEQIVQGDILIRCRHLTFKKQRVSMFRSAFHTGYVPPNVMRFTKSQLDGACSDARFSDDFFLDFIFEKVDAETATKHLEEEAAAQAETHEKEESNKTAEGKSKNEPAILKAGAYDSMLQGESRFWDVITARRKANAAQDNKDPNFGPTVGRRRGDGNKKKNKNSGDGTADGQGNGGAGGSVSKERTELDSFSIGGEFDFLPTAGPATETAPKRGEEQRKDSLMEALNALDEDDGAAAAVQSNANVGTETVVFDQASANTSIAGTEDAASVATTQDGTVASTTTDKSEQKPGDSQEGVASSDDVQSSNASKAGTESAVEVASKSDVDDMDAILDFDMGEDFGDVNLDDFDVDGVDDDLEDLENLLKL